MSTSVEERERRLPAAGVPFPDHVLVPQPAVGASAVFKLDANWEWSIQSLLYTLATSAVAGNRSVFVDYADPDGTRWIRNLCPNQSIAGSAGDTYSHIVGLGSAATIVFSGVQRNLFAPLADVWLPRGWQLQINVSGMDVGDQLSAIKLYVLKRLAV